MFTNIGWSEAFVLIIAALVILGPERLPGAVSWVTRSLRKVREYATGATSQLKEEFGTDFDEFRKPIQQLNELRGMSPRSMITKHLLDGDDTVIREFEDTARSATSAAESTLKPSSPMYKPQLEKSQLEKPASAAESGPLIDPDAT